jgi:hypothetical protein
VTVWFHIEDSWLEFTEILGGFIGYCEAQGFQLLSEVAWGKPVADMMALFNDRSEMNGFAGGFLDGRAPSVDRREYLTVRLSAPIAAVRGIAN